VNADGLRNQLEGGVVQGWAAPVRGMRVERGRVASRDWTTYPVLRFDDVPDVHVVVLDRRGLPPLGVGEASTPPPAPALANAIDDRVGIRLRHLPVTPERTLRRISEMSEREAERVRL
jgi:nicotinate dehydrogenase subunit B